MSNNPTEGDQIFGQTLPGTGGDLEPVDGQDVEGHTAEADGKAGFNPDAPRPGEGISLRVDGSDESDVEGHLFRTGPTTEGEFTRQGPGTNPHGDR